MSGLRIPLHGVQGVLHENASVHRQLMFNATQGKGFRPDFMKRTVLAEGETPVSFFNEPLSKRQIAKAAARALYLARCKAPSRALNRDRAGITARVQRRMYDELKAITV